MNHSFAIRSQRIFVRVAGALIPAIFLACSISLIAVPESTAETSRKGKSKQSELLTLSLIGYNYTDRNIEEYSVNGVSGGHVFMSSSTSGGSGDVCCMTIKRNIEELSEIRVRWQHDGCKYSTKSISGRMYDQRHLFYREAQIRSSSLAGQPHYVETHFYPDGSVKIMLTERPSLPLVVRNEKRPDLSNFPRCKDEKRPVR